MIQRSNSTVAITIPAISTAAVTLTATQVTALAGVKALGVASGLLLGRALSGGRGRRQAVDQGLNTVEDVVTLLAKSELQQCTQLLFCTAATKNANLDLDKVSDSPLDNIQSSFTVGGC